MNIERKAKATICCQVKSGSIIKKLAVKRMKTNLISFVDHGEKIKTKLKTLLPTQHGSMDQVKFH